MSAFCCFNYIRPNRRLAGKFFGSRRSVSGNALPRAGRFGNAAVGSLVGPGTINLSLGLARDFKITERITFKFETSFTNVPNHPNFDDPRNNLTECTGSPCLGTFGQVQAARTGDAGGNRVGQFALRLEF